MCAACAHRYSSLETQPAYQTSGQKYRVYKRSPFGLTLRELFAHSRNFGDRDFIVYEDERYTFEQTFAQVDAIAAALVNTFAVKKGDRVAVSSRNYPEWCIAFMAAASIGAIVVPVNSLWNGEELEYGMNDSGTKVLFCDQERLDLVAPLLGSKCPGLSAVIAIRSEPSAHEMVSSYSDVLAAHAGAPMPDIDIAQDDDATLFYTSGTTGNPKGTLSTNRAVMSAVNTLGVGVAMKQAAGKGGIYEGKQGCGLVSVPLFHVTGSHAIFLAAVLQGSKLVLMFKWDVITALEHIQNEGVTGFTGVPTMWLDLVSHPDYDKYDTSTLKSIGGGGAAPPKKAGSDVAKKGTVFACPPQHALSTHIRTRSPLLLLPLPLPRPGNASIECGVIWSVALTCFNRVCIWVSFCRRLPGSGLGHDRDQRHHRQHQRQGLPRPPRLVRPAESHVGPTYPRRRRQRHAAGDTGTAAVPRRGAYEGVLEQPPGYSGQHRQRWLA
jgi:non-ribosomal peptide synthetase component F